MGITRTARRSSRISWLCSHTADCGGGASIQLGGSWAFKDELVEVNVSQLDRLAGIDVCQFGFLETP
jgi:hypothetical protein